MARGSIDDYRWLISDDAAAYLQTAASASADDLVRVTQSLRRDLTTDRAHLVLEQVELRRRARDKFSRAEAMFFTRQLLEQSTDEVIARHKTQRFPVGQSIADLCCGIGGDLMGIAARGPAVGVDLDPVTCLLAETNCHAIGLECSTETADVGVVDIGQFAAWHVDPDRRPAGTRTSNPDFSGPSPAVVGSLLQHNPNGAIKLAPAAEIPSVLDRDVEREWVASRRECRQQVAWYGELAKHPSRHTATVVGSAVDASFSGLPDAEPEFANEIGAYVFDPSPSLVAAQLVGAFANANGLDQIRPGIAYLTSDVAFESPLISTFRVEETTAFDVKRLRALLRDRGIGRLEIKTRAIDVAPERLRGQLRLRGDDSCTMFVIGPATDPQVVVASRC